MYVELTPEDTLRDLQMLLIQSLSGFEFPRFQLNNYTINTTIKDKENLSEEDFVIGDTNSIFRENPFLTNRLSCIIKKKFDRFEKGENRS